MALFSGNLEDHCTDGVIHSDSVAGALQFSASGLTWRNARNRECSVTVKVADFTFGEHETVNIGFYFTEFELTPVCTVNNLTVYDGESSYFPLIEGMYSYMSFIQ